MDNNEDAPPEQEQVLSPGDTVVLEFIHRNDTTGTRRFREVLPDEEHTYLGDIYLRKGRVGPCKRLTVTIEVTE